MTVAGAIFVRYRPNSGQSGTGTFWLKPVLLTGAFSLVIETCS